MLLPFSSVSNSSLSLLSSSATALLALDKMFRAIFFADSTLGGQDGSPVGFLTFAYLSNLAFIDDESRAVRPFSQAHASHRLATLAHALAPIGSNFSKI